MFQPSVSANQIAITFLPPSVEIRQCTAVTTQTDDSPVGNVSSQFDSKLLGVNY